MSAISERRGARDGSRIPGAEPAERPPADWPDAYRNREVRTAGKNGREGIANQAEQAPFSLLHDEERVCKTKKTV